MNRIQKIGIGSLCVALAAAAVVPPLLRGAPADNATGTTSRAPAAIKKDMVETNDELVKYFPSAEMLGDAEFRKGDGQKSIPLLKKMAALLQEAQDGATDKDDKEFARVNKFTYLSLAGALGDQDTLAMFAEKAKGKDADAVSSQAALALHAWLGAGKNSDAQIKVIDDFSSVMKDHPENDEITSMLGVMTNFGVPSGDVTKHMVDALRTNMKGSGADGLIARLDALQEMVAMVGKSLVISGRTSTGGTFASTQYKGKVVLIDFWATWCGPCIGELPNVKKAYADFHDKGFEIVGLSCDGADDVLNEFTQKNMMPWVQLRETSQTDMDNWNPVAKKLHVEGIPAMFLIDRKGILRSVDAREDLGKKVSQLLTESDSAAK